MALGLRLYQLWTRLATVGVLVALAVLKWCARC
eukprot:SAG31_NODE_18479_length_634_cov_8.132710_1_plen_32_part_10